MSLWDFSNMGNAQQDTKGNAQQDTKENAQQDTKGNAQQDTKGNNQQDTNLYKASVHTESKTEHTKMQKLCEQCEQKKLIKAFCVDCQEYLCEECSVYHCRPSLMRHHRLLKENQIPRKKTSISEHCVKHADEVNKYYCERHSECCCPVCAITVHKNCVLKALSDITKGYLTSKEYDDSKKDLMLLEKLVRNKNDNIEKELVLGNKSVNAALQELSYHRNQINKHFDQLEEELKSDALDVTIKNYSTIGPLSRSCKAILTKIERMKYDLSVLEETQQESLLFAAVKENKNTCEQIKASIEKLDADTIVRQVKLCKNRVSNSLTIRKDLLGYLQVFVEEKEHGNKLKGRSKHFEEKDISNDESKEDKDKEEESKKREEGQYFDDDLTYISENQKEGSCKNCEAGNTHSNCPLHTDFGVFPKLLLFPKAGVILEYCKSKISILKANFNKPTNIVFSTGPWDMDKVAENTLAVTMPHEKKIKFLYVEKNKIEEAYEIATPGFCRYIAVDDDTLVVTFSEPPGIKQIDMFGQVLRNLMSNDDGTILFLTPSSVAVAGRQIFVTDPNMRTITRMNLVDRKNTRRKFKSFKPSYLYYSNNELNVSSCDTPSTAKMTCDLKIKKIENHVGGDENVVTADVRVFPNNIAYISSFIKTADNDDVADDDEEKIENGDDAAADDDDKEEEENKKENDDEEKEEEEDEKKIEKDDDDNDINNIEKSSEDSEPSVL